MLSAESTDENTEEVLNLQGLLQGDIPRVRGRGSKRNSILLP